MSFMSQKGCVSFIICILCDIKDILACFSQQLQVEPRLALYTDADLSPYFLSLKRKRKGDKSARMTTKYVCCMICYYFTANLNNNDCRDKMSSRPVLSTRLLI
ncbi:unnamed protein product [Chrysodeixis includens]|uniref:Uncharacterized protein n=1 Tax=Chrysodeixis includens TaxID=689277 RepID=A0A9N8KTC7_CHRIL|nr:unnamed protein product [Chrysodeixis includens]